MKITKENREKFEKGKVILEKAKVSLKEEFVGLDDIIDEVIDLIEPWYLFPEGQIRPTIINLFGLTGVGKTSLIKRLFHFLELDDDLYKFDVGDYASQGNSKLSYAFSEELKNREGHKIGVIFDEFQLGRTIEGGAELEKSGLRAMWDLLDSGKVSILQSSYFGTRTFQLALKLEDCVENGDVEAKDGIITKNKSYHEKYFKFENEEEDEDEGDNVKEDVVTGDVDKPTNKKTKKEKEKPDHLFVPKSFYWPIQSVWEDRFISENELREFLKTMDHQETLDFLDDTFKKAFRPIEYDYSTSCIFVIGNIDEAYRMSHSVDPDSDADRFYKHSLKITLPQIKSALKRRFRSEQIARLGNNHVIYPAFSSKVYRELIKMELEKTAVKVKDRFDFDIEFDKSVESIIYKEGVFPTQGARPVFTTITSLIESYIGKIVKEILENGSNVEKVKWSFSRNKHSISLINEKGNTVSTKRYPVRLKVESLRKSTGDERQAHVAIHEAGHAVAAIYGLGILPTEIVSRTANMSEGHCSIEFPEIETKETMEKEIVVCLAGYVAEKMIFGDNSVSNGTGSDFKRATEKAMEMMKSYGMGEAPMLYGHKNVSTNAMFNTANVEEMEKLAETLVKKCEKECNKILTENKLLLLKIGEYLSTNSRMESKKTAKFVEQFGKQVKLKDKDSYHSFKRKISDAIKSEENTTRPKIGVAKYSPETLSTMNSKKKKDD